MFKFRIPNFGIWVLGSGAQDTKIIIVRVSTLYMISAFSFSAFTFLIFYCVGNLVYIIVSDFIHSNPNL